MFPILVIIDEQGNLINQFRSSYVPELNETLLVDKTVYKVINKHTHIVSGNFEIHIIVQ